MKENTLTAAAVELRQKAEAAFREKAASATPESEAALSPEQIRRTLQELRVHQIELEMQNKELRRAQVELDAARARYFDLYDLAPVGYVTVSEPGMILEANLTAATLLGVARGALIKQPFSRFILKADSDGYYLMRKQLVATGDSQSRELRMLKPESTQIWVQLVATLAPDADGAAVRVTLSDITRSKQTEEVQTFLAQANTRKADDSFFNGLARFLAQSLQMDYVCIDRLEGDQLTAQTLAVWCDGHFEDNVTYALKDTPCGDVVGQTVCCFPASVCKYFPRDAALQTLRAESYVGVTLFSHAGQPIGLIAVIGRGPLANRAQAEATLKLVAGRAAGELERFEHEKALRESETRFREMFDDAPIGYHELDAEGRIVRVNRTELALLGYSAGEMLGRQVWEFVEDSELSRRAVLDKLAGILPSGQSVERTYRRKDGTGVPLLIQDRLLLDQEGKSIGIRTTVQDISERKQAEEALQLNQRSLALAHRSAKAGAWDWDMTTQRLQWTPELFVLFGLDPDRTQANFEIWHQVLHPDDRETAGARLEQAIKERRPLSNEYRVVRPDGQVRWIHAVGETTYDPSGKPVRMTGLCTDITERRAAEQTLRLRGAALEAAANAVVITDRQCSIEWVNPAFSALSGWTFAEALGKDAYDLVKSGEQPEEFYEQMRATIHAGKIWQGQMINRRKDGALRTEEMTITPLRDEQGGISHFIAIKQDITDQKAMETQFLQAQRMEVIGALAGGIAHDLNNILAPITMVGDLLKEKLSDPADLELVDMALSGSKRGAEIIKQLLTFGRGQQGRRVAVQLRHLIREMLQVMRETFPREIDLRHEASADLWPVVGDSTQLHQVLLNLCVNSRDAMRTGGCLSLGAANATLAVGDGVLPPDKTPGPYVALAISDTGHGISPEIQHRIFDPFFTTKPIGEGTGLGLSTVLAIVRNHGGFIRLDSAAGKGSTFKVFLPACPDEVATVAAPSLRPPPAHGGSQTILVVDDERNIRDATRALFERGHFLVLTATHGEDALAQFLQHRDTIKLVLTDVMMPVMNGLTLVRELRRIEPTVKIVAMSGLGDVEHGTELAALGVLEVLMKPCTGTALIETIHRHLAKP